MVQQSGKQSAPAPACTIHLNTVRGAPSTAPNYIPNVLGFLQIPPTAARIDKKMLPGINAGPCVKVCFVGGLILVTRFTFVRSMDSVTLLIVSNSGLQ